MHCIFYNNKAMLRSKDWCLPFQMRELRLRAGKSLPSVQSSSHRARIQANICPSSKPMLDLLSSLSLRQLLISNCVTTILDQKGMIMETDFRIFIIFFSNQK